MSQAMNQVQNRRGQVGDVKTEMGAAIIEAKIPVAEMFGFDATLKSATSGRGFYSLIENAFERIPNDLLEGVVKEIRKRKGLSEDIPKPE